MPGLRQASLLEILAGGQKPDKQFFTTALGSNVGKEDKCRKIFVMWPKAGFIVKLGQAQWYTSAFSALGRLRQEN